jgi:hypothetical protein
MTRSCSLIWVFILPRLPVPACFLCSILLYTRTHNLFVMFAGRWVAGSKNSRLAFRLSSAKMAPVTTQTANAPKTHHKKTRRGLRKKGQARVVSDVDMVVDEDSALTANNTEGIVSLLDPSSTSSQPLPSATSAQQAAATSAIDKSTQQDEDDEEMLLDISPPAAPPATETGGISVGFAPLPAAAAQGGTKKSEIRRIPIPPHRMSPLKKDWVNIFVPLTEMCGLQVRMNVQRRTVEIRVSIFVGNMSSEDRV